MKKVKLLIFSLFLLLTPSIVFAKSDVYYKNLFMDVNINDDGSISVRELDSFGGSYNGLLRSLGYANNNDHFTGIKEDFYGSDIYNGSNITDLKVGDISKDDIVFDDINSDINYYKEVIYASVGDYGIYTKNTTGSSVDLKVYSPSNYNKAIYYEYRINDMVVKHNDVSELAWTICSGRNWENSIDNLEIRIHLPGNDPTMRVWGHGVLQGYVDRNSDNMITMHASDVGEYNDLGIRIMFDNSLTSSNKYSHVDGKENILAVEKELAIKANNIRKRARIREFVVKYTTYLWFIAIISFTIYVYFKYDREYNYVFNNEYYRELPGEYSPATLEYLLKKKITELSFSTTIIDLIRRKNISFSEITDKKKDYKLTLENEEGLSKEESKVVGILFNLVGNGKEVTLRKLKKYGKSESKARRFLDRFNSWKKAAKEQAETEKFYESHIDIKVKGIILSSISLVLFVVSAVLFSFDLVSEAALERTFLALFVGIVFLIYFIFFRKKTMKGIEHYKKWKAFRNFLRDFGRFDEKELPEITLWEKYLVYAHILGCAKNLEKQMKFKIKEIYPDDNAPTMIDFYIMDRMMDANIARSITSTVHSAVSASNSTIASSTASSIGGSGGGFSGGGGSFGGGGGSGSF